MGFGGSSKSSQQQFAEERAQMQTQFAQSQAKSDAQFQQQQAAYQQQTDAILKQQKAQQDQQTANAMQTAGGFFGAGSPTGAYLTNGVSRQNLLS